jgi:tetratricopeptide (TPR) repeat protein
MRNNKSFIPIFISFLLVASIVLFSNYKVHIAYNKQRTIINAIAKSDYLFSDDYIDRISSGYPNLSATAIPFKSLIGAHWINKDSLEKGLNLIREGSKENPYIGFGDMIAANVYQALGVKDSFAYYTRSSNNKLPNAAVNYALLSRLLLWEDKLDSLNLLFNKIADRVRDKEVWKVYLSTMATRKNEVDTIQSKLNAYKAKQIWPENDQIRLVADYVIYGIENVKESMKLRRLAIDSFEKNPNLSTEYMNKALELVQDDMQNYETLLEMYFKLGDDESVIKVYDKLNELNLTNLTPPTIEIITVSLLRKNDQIRGCYLARVLFENQYTLSSPVIRTCNLN